MIVSNWQVLTRFVSRMLGINRDTSTTNPLPSDGLLGEEIKSWDGYRAALHKRDRIVFEEMFSGLGDYAEAANLGGDLRASDSLLMVLIFEQYKMIEGIRAELQRMT